MSTELTVALLSGALALAAGGLATWGQWRSTRLAAELTHVRETERTAAKFREPLARSAYDLQSRLFNILAKGLVENHMVGADEREADYVVDNTAFLIAQYLAWAEIIRVEIQFIDVGEDDKTGELARLQDEIVAIFQTSDLHPLFRVFAGEQRAIGERMIFGDENGPCCSGYGAFLDRLATSPDQLIEPLRDDVRQLATHLDDARPRLVALQHSLIDLLEFLDPKFVRFPAERRSKA